MVCRASPEAALIEEQGANSKRHRQVSRQTGKGKEKAPGRAEIATPLSRNGFSETSLLTAEGSGTFRA
jgi:hypothetical protein